MSEQHGSIANRRDFLKLSAGLMSLGLLPPQLMAGREQAIKAMAFDAFPIFDPRSVFARVNKLFPDQGKQFSLLWRTRIFEYTWLRTAAGQYKDFWGCIEDALQFVARDLQINLSQAQQQQLMSAFLELKPYADVLPMLKSLKDKGVELGFLSNMTETMLLTNIERNGLQGMFQQVISTDEVKTFKPDVRAYQLAIDRFGLKKQEIMFVAFASWDASGAKWFGYPTAWVNRLGFKPEELGAVPDISGKDLSVFEGLITT